MPCVELCRTRGRTIQWTWGRARSYFLSRFVLNFGGLNGGLTVAYKPSKFAVLTAYLSTYNLNRSLPSGGKAESSVRLTRLEISIIFVGDDTFENQKLRWQTFLAIRRWTEIYAKANLGVVEITLRVGNVATAAATKSMNVRARTATLWKALLDYFRLACCRYRPKSFQPFGYYRLTGRGDRLNDLSKRP